MKERKISIGKRPKNPLAKRVWKELRRDWKQYLMIFSMLIVTIGFVSGMYVANHSMMQALDESKDKFVREGGHFELSGKADDALLTGIESGEIADMVNVFRERAYEEVEEEVRAAVNEALTETVQEKVRDEIYEQTEHAVDAQLSALKEMGGTFMDEERQNAIDDAFEAAMTESYDQAVAEVLQDAFDSEDYQKAFDDAMVDAKKEIDNTIDEEYAELAERYELDDRNFNAVPVKVYELFYKQNEETTPNHTENSMIRVYQERTEVNLYDLLEGRSPETEREIIIDRMHGDNVGLKVGDTIAVGGVDFEIVVLAAFTDYSCLYESNTDTMFDAISFDIGMTTNDGFERIRGATHYNYAFLYENKPADIYEEAVFCYIFSQQCSLLSSL